MDLLQGLEAFFRAVPLDAGDRIVVAFSGGGDSTALLWGLVQHAPRWRIRVLAAHLDHGMDEESGARLGQAAGIARRLGVPLVAERREVARHRLRGEGPQAAARRLRYQFLERVRRAARARYVTTAHHREDQAETVLLRLAFGSGLRGLAGIRPADGPLLRPLLDLPRASLRAAVSGAGLVPAEDPGNADPRQPRSRMRHRVLPALAAGDGPTPSQHGGAEVRHGLLPGAGQASPAAEGRGQDACAELVETLARLARRAALASAALDRRLEAAMRAHPGCAVTLDDGGAHELAKLDTECARALPAPLLPHALALLHRRAGAAYPASRAAQGELMRQVRRGLPAGRIACDCGGGWRWSSGADGALLVGRVATAATPSFTYTLEIPGVLTIPEIAMRIRVREAPVETWMWRGAARRAALARPEPLDAAAGTGQPGQLGKCWSVRNRRPGDRLRPLGSPGSRKLKDVLIDRGVPRGLRDKLPLLCWGEEIAWVPGVTVGHRFRLSGRPASVLVVELEEIRSSGAAS